MADINVTTAQYGTVVTDIGAAKIAASILNGTKINITHAAVGDGNGAYYYPVASQTALLNERWRGEIAFAEINKSTSNMIDVKFIVPADVGGFTIREAAILDAEGDTIAICNTPDAQKIPITDGVSFPLTMMMHIVVTDASAIDFKVNTSLDTISREDMDKALAEYAAGVGTAIMREINIPSAGWTSATNMGEYIYTIDVAVPDALDAHFPTMALDVPSLAISADAELCPTMDALDGFVRFWAKEIPTADMAGTIMLRSENMNFDGSTDFDCNCDCDDGSGGSGGSGPGSAGDSDVATDEEVDETIEEVFGSSAVATDEEVAQIVSDIFGG